ncbi:MAG: retroviral-like aspartic protease family protein [Bacteroidota bacterium]
MGLVYAEIELINGGDMEMASRNLMDKDEVRHMQVNMLVDSGAYMMAINESIQELLQFRSKGKRKVRMADESVVEYEVVGPIEVRFKNRSATCNAFVLPGNSEPLLGVIPMEEMDVIILPLRQQLVVNPENPDYAVLKMKSAS